MTGEAQREPGACKSDVDRPVSVICTVRNDAAGLAQLLSSLDRQTLLPSEIVVVDGGSTDDAPASVRSAASRHERVRLIERGDLNIAQGRNLAIREARHDLIACADAGCEADPHWLERLTAPLRRGEADVAGGYYAVGSCGWLPRLVARLSLPGMLRPVDPERFNPSARSLALTREAWRRAGGFPEWLTTAEDTLFDLKLRSLEPPLRYIFVGDATVTWTPRAGVCGVFRQYAGYARGEGHLGRGKDGHRHLTLRYAAIAIWACASGICAARDLTTFAGCALVLALLLAARLHLGAAIRSALQDRDRPGALRLIARTARAAAVSELLTAARWFGFRRGHSERRRSPEQYVAQLRRYMTEGGALSGSVEHVPPWRTVNLSPPPRTLVVSWQWPPVNRASANVLATLFNAASPASFRVLTRRMCNDGDGVRAPRLETERVAWPLPDDRPVRFRTFLAELRTFVRVLARAWRMHLTWDVQVVLSVYPTRYGLLSGWAASRLLGVPHVAYMHDLLRETLLTKSRLKRAFWCELDERILRGSRVILTPTREHAEHYARRGLANTAVLPHTVDDADAEEPSSTLVSQQAADVATQGSRPLRLVYSGAIYEPHLDAVEAIIEATKSEPEIELIFLTKPQPALAGLRMRWLEPRRMRAAIRSADAGVVALGWRTPYPDEIRVCFPSKIVDYLGAGRPILAVVPRGCFVDRFVRETGCGVCANEPTCDSIRAACRELQDSAKRARFSERACAAARSLRPARWMRRLEDALRRATGVACGGIVSRQDADTARLGSAMKLDEPRAADFIPAGFADRAYAGRP
ncbi:MAG: hypothetical protein FLDDKLPJ_03123 [Phycisphaerae bacterium]|nr:hypothetical protein [Phycisphaerae bacterium]